MLVQQPSDLVDLSFLLHDQILLLDRVRLDESATRLTIPLLLRDLKAKSLIRPRLLSRDYLAPLVCHVLIVAQVCSYDVQHDQGIGFYTISGLGPRTPSGLIVSTGERASLAITTTGIAAVLVTDGAVGGHQWVSEGLFGQRFGRIEFS
jgi:hypothetical protein